MKAKIILFLLLVACVFSQAPGNALEFDGTAGKVQINTSFNFGNISHTIECWVKIPEVGTCNLDPGERVGIVFGNFDNLFNTSYEIYDAGQMRVYWNNSQVELLGTTDLRDGRWHHIAFIRDIGNDKFQIYLDGKLEAESVSAGWDIDFTGYFFCIGSDHRPSPLYFHGTIDELRFWTGVRSADEIRDNMYKELNGNETNLANYYNFNHTTGTNLQNSATITGATFNATITGLTDANWVKSGAFEGSNKCLEFDGINDYVYLTNDSQLKPTASFTVECWVNPSDWTVSGSIEKFIGNTHSGGYALSLHHDSLRFEAYDGSVYKTAMYPASSISAGWHHVAGVFDGTDIILYLDGTELDRTTFGAATISYHASNYTIIGAEADHTNGNEGDLYSGKIDEVRIWSDARDANEIRTSMCQALRGTETNLAAYYRFDDNGGTNLNELVAGRDGTLQNMDDADWVVSNAFTSWYSTGSDDFSLLYNWSDGLPNTTKSATILSGYTNPAPNNAINIFNLVIPSGTLLDMNQIAGNISVYGNYFQIGDVVNLSSTSGTLNLHSNAFGPTKHRLTSNSVATFKTKPIFE